MSMLFTILAEVENGASVDENVFFSSSYVLEYKLIFLSWLELKMDACLFKKKHIFLKNMFFLELNFQDESHFHANCFFCILSLCRKFFYFQFLYCGISKHISTVYTNKYIFMRPFHVKPRTGK